VKLASDAVESKMAIAVILFPFRPCLQLPRGGIAGVQLCCTLPPTESDGMLSLPW
jgi:hypothetical protein